MNLAKQSHIYITGGKKNPFFLQHLDSKCLEEGKVNANVILRKTRVVLHLTNTPYTRIPDKSFEIEVKH